MLLDAKAIITVSNILDATDWYRPAHALIHRAIHAMQNREEPVDHLTLQAQLSNTGALQAAGGLEYLFTLAESVPTAANAEHYARQVKTAAIRRRQIEIAHELIAGANDAETDTETVAAEVTRKLVGVMTGSRTQMHKVADLANKHYDSLSANVERSRAKQWRTGIPTIDDKFDTIGEARLVVLKARRGSGKTHIGVDWAYHCAYHGRTAVIYSLEMNAMAMCARVTARAGGVDSRTMSRPVTDNDWVSVASASAAVQNLPVLISAGRGVTTAKMSQQLSALKAEGADIGLVVIDYAELIGSPPGKQSREQELSSIAIDLQQVADTVDGTVLLLSQTNKEGGERYSEAIGNSADLLLHWEAVDGGYLLTAEKSRFGRSFRVPCRLDCRISAVSEIDERIGEE